TVAKIRAPEHGIFRLHSESMFPNVHLVEVVGKYAGSSGVVLLLLTGIMYVLLHSPGTHEDKEKRFTKFISLTALLGVLGILSPILQSLISSRTPTSVTENT